MRRSVRFSLMLVACTSFSVSLRAATEADIESSFFPYAKGMPTFPG